MVLRDAAAMNSSEFGLTGAVVPVNSTPAQNMNYSHMGTTNSSQRVDLDGLNLSTTHALMPTILFLVLIMVMGGVGNTVVLLVYYHRFKPSVIRTYILSMSVCDALASVISLPAEILSIRYYFTYDLPLVCKSHKSLNLFLLSTSAFILVAVATDRVAKFCWQKHMSMRRIRINVLICTLFALAVSLYAAVVSGSRTMLTGVGNTTAVTCSLISDSHRYTLFPFVFYVIGTLSFVSCNLIIVVSYIRMALEVRRYKQRQTHMSGVVPMITIYPADRHCRTAIPNNAYGPAQEEAFNLHSTQPAAGTCTTHECNIISRSRSLLRRLRAPRTRCDHVDDEEGKTPVHSVKAIPSSTTIMMFILAVIYIIVNVPFFIVSILRSTSTIFDKGLTAAKLNLYSIGLMSPFLNCAVNCIFYSFCNPRFRHECRRFFARK